MEIQRGFAETSIFHAQSADSFSCFFDAFTRTGCTNVFFVTWHSFIKLLINATHTSQHSVTCRLCCKCPCTLLAYHRPSRGTGWSRHSGLASGSSGPGWTSPQPLCSGGKNDRTPLTEQLHSQLDRKNDTCTQSKKDYFHGMGSNDEC